MDGNGNPCGMWCLDCLALNKIQIDPHQKCKCVIFPTFTGATYPKTYQSTTQYIIAHGSSIWGKCHLSRSLNIAHYLGCTSVKGIDKLPVVIGTRFLLSTSTCKSTEVNPHGCCVTLTHLASTLTSLKPSRTWNAMGWVDFPNKRCAWIFLVFLTTWLAHEFRFYVTRKNPLKS